MEELHGDLKSARIGIPQGGGLSNILANVMLHVVDERMDQLLPQTSDACYLRYCDDMIIVTTNREQCEAALQAALAILKCELLLPVHPPVPVTKYDAAFWKMKSRQPYCWCEPCFISNVPWLQFLGYQLRHDGLMRVGKKSLIRQQMRIREEADRVLRFSAPSARLGTKFLRRIVNRLVNMSVGKKGIRHGWPDRCWADSFGLLRQRAQCLAPLISLDRYRERNIRRILRLGEARGWGVPKIKRRGFAFSYLARFGSAKKARR